MEGYILKKKSLLILLIMAVAMSSLVSGLALADDHAQEVQRTAGADRYETSADTALAAYPDGSDRVIIANGEDAFGFADGLSASALAGAADAPILLVHHNGVPATIADAIDTLGATKAYVLGGTTVIPQAVEDALGLDATRLAGDDRIATSLAVAEQVAVYKADDLFDTVYIVSATANADALAAGPAAFNATQPVIADHTGGSSMTPEVHTLLAAWKDLGVDNAVIVGGTAVVSEWYETHLYEMMEFNVTRLGGDNRLGTALDFAGDQYADIQGVSIVNGLSLADAVGAAVNGDPVLYVQNAGTSATGNAEVWAYITELLEDNAELNITIFGGTSVVSPELQNAIQGLVNDETPEELAVTSVSAIDQTVVAGELDDPTTLSVEVNGEEVVTAEDLPSYEVLFEASAGVFVDGETTSSTGVLEDDLTAGTSDFSYRVTVSQDGDVVAGPSAFADVTVANAAVIVLSIDSVKATITADDIEVTSGKIELTDSDVNIVVEGELADDPGEVVDITDKVDYKTSSSSRLTVAADGSVTLPGNTGDVTVTVEGTDEVSSTIDLTVVDGARELNVDNTEVDTSDISLKNEASHEITVHLKDQYGDSFKETVTAVTDIEDKDDVAIKIADVAVGTDLIGEQSLVLTAKAVGEGSFDLAVDGTEIAEGINVEVLAIADVASYSLELQANEESEVKLNQTTPETVLQLVPIDEDGYKLAAIVVDGDMKDADNLVYKVESNDEDVATVAWTTSTKNIVVTGKATGTATITVEQEASEDTGVFDVVGTFTVTVTDDRIQLTDVTFKDVDGLTVASIAGPDLADVINKITTNPEDSDIKFEDSSTNVLTIQDDDTDVTIGYIKLFASDGANTPTFADGADNQINADDNGIVTLVVEDVFGNQLSEVDLTVAN